MSEIAAYIGLVQLAKLDSMTSKRQAAADIIAVQLRALGIDYCDTSHMDKASQYKFIIHLPKSFELGRVKKFLLDKGIICGGGVYEVPCHLQPVFAHVPFDKSELSATEKWCPRHFCPPITSGTTEEEAYRIASALEEALK
jgi:dTDP-4-amino-4,6-dideoxygalactose transaminase